MRRIFALLLLGLAASPLQAEGPKRSGAPDSPISASVEVPAGSRLIYVSGQVPEVINPAAPDGSVEQFGDTEAQTRSVIHKIEGVLKQSGLGLGDVVMMRVFLVAPPGQSRMDFAGMMRGYSASFGTKEQANKPARSTMQVAGLVREGWLVEIEVTAAKK
ncbi:RidA family protein [Sphingomonas alba]|uniref:RidA family protein n=1 Tax=Sphingomonas alba TaxID=2908208 RepID=A0ABT0RKI8_9SPHN|nr:RidA family protein [Sphingomonas alba]MCL6683141.1 RidA family protein [Sphingomonas alba]